MKNLATMDINQVVNQSTSDLTTSTGNYTDADKELINKLFARLTVMFPAWKQAFVSSDQIKEAKRAWMDGLINNQITTQEQLINGLKECEKHDSPFMPSVGQFIKWCKPESAPYHQLAELPHFSEPSTPEFVENLLRENGLK